MDDEENETVTSILNDLGKKEELLSMIGLGGDVSAGLANRGVLTPSGPIAGIAWL